VVADTDPAAAILGHAEREGCDLIAMATHGRGGVTRLLLGSVAARVLAGTPGPILLFRPWG
jgi:nucleotide-binding universal stress UspA family protein